MFPSADSLFPLGLTLKRDENDGVMQAVSDYRYVGSELALAGAAVRWKTYWSGEISRFIRGDVLEVGAGIGSNTRFLRGFASGRWVCLEPDSEQAGQLKRKLNESPGTSGCEIVCGMLNDIPEGIRFDTIVYIDVLEHIEDDSGELRLAEKRLRPGGRVVVLSPAYQFLYTHFDAAIGHYRRCSRSALRKLTPASLQLEALFNLDTCGIAASAMNKLILRQALPTEAQLQMWDRWIVPASRLLDPLVIRTIGKSVVAVWRKPLPAD